MNLTPERAAQGRRNFLKILAGTPALAALGVSAALKGPVAGGPCASGFIGVGGQGRSVLRNVDPAFADVRAHLRHQSRQPGAGGRSPRTQQAAGRSSLRRLERDAPEGRHRSRDHGAAAVGSTPISTVGCLDAGKHVLCEKMMAWDVAGCERMREAARRNGKVLEIGYQRTYNAMYQAAYDGLVKSGALGDIYHVRLAWHRNGNWRRKGEPPSPDYDPSKWGYPTFDHLAQLASVLEVFPGTDGGALQPSAERDQLVPRIEPEAVSATGGLYRFRRTAAKSSTTSTPLSSIPAARRPCFPPSNRTPSTTTTRCSWERRAR